MRRDELIYDVGMHNGDDTAYYLRQGHRVVAVEANPQLVERARERFADALRAGRLDIVNVAIADEDGERDFWICEGMSEWSSFDRAVASRNGMSCHPIRVRTRRFGGILAEHGVPTYVKIDIEGSDVLCLRDLDPQHLPAYVSVESECLDETGADTSETIGVLRLLADRGYRRFKLVEQRTLAPLTFPPNVHLVLDRLGRALERSGAIPFRALRAVGGRGMAARCLTRSRLNRRDGWQFAVGSSGPWGEGIPGPWMDLARAERTYRMARDRHFRNPNARAYGFWCDWHAAL